MGKTLIIVESPAKVKTIQKYLGNDYIIRASYGHICNLASTGKNKLGIDIEKGFVPSYEISLDKKDKIKSIIDAARTADLILSATDDDREGSCISFHIANEIEKKIGKVPIKRMVFNQLTKKAILDGIANSYDLSLEQNKYDAQQARRVVDRLVGYLVSPFIINLIGPNLSAGRVQSVALRMIVDLEREIESFVAEEYWNIYATLSKNKEKFIVKYQGKISSKEEAFKIKEELENDTYQVSEVISETKPKEAPPPLKTVTLQQLSSKKYKLSSDKTMQAAQVLYESGYISYIRTDSTRSSPESLEDLRLWLQNKKYDIPDKPIIYAVKKNAQDAHEAIRPTDLNLHPDKINVNENERKIYKLVWERFIASQMKPALYDTVSVTIKTSSNKILKCQGKVLKYKGWLEFLNLKDEDEKLPILNKNDNLNLVAPKIKTEQKFTQPPSRYKDHSLIKDLEAKGIGRPSTYANILTKVTHRNYVEKKDEQYYATNLGKQVCDILVKYFDFMDLKYTAKMEEELDKIEEGEISYLEMLNNFFPKFKKQLKLATVSSGKNYNINCNICNDPMLLKHGIFGYYMECINYPECKTTQSCEIIDNLPVLKAAHSKTNRDIVDDVFCIKCSSPMFIRDGKFGKFYCCTQYPKCTSSRKIPSGYKCQKCGYDMYITLFDSESKLACMGYPDCKNIIDLPEGTSPNWIDPKKITNNIDKTLKKILK